MADTNDTDAASPAQRSTPRLTRIYTLSDPRTEEVRYVGKTVTSLPQRFSIHLATSRSKVRGRSHTAAWIRSLEADGVRPVIRQIDIAGDDWVECERRWIAKFRADGADLTNHTDGGEGMAGYRPNPATLEKRSTSLRTFYADPIACQRQGAASLARWADPEYRARVSAAISAGKSAQNEREVARLRSLAIHAADPTIRARQKVGMVAHYVDNDADRKRQSAAAAARWADPEYRERVSASQRRRRATERAIRLAAKSEPPD
jgi:hypothetical protein